MQDKPIKIPIQKLDFEEAPDFQISKKSILQNATTTEDFKMGSDGLIEMSLSKLLKLLSKYDQEQIEVLHGTEMIKVSSDFLLEMASFEHEVEADDNNKVSWILAGLVLGVFVGLLVFLIFLK